MTDAASGTFQADSVRAPAGPSAGGSATDGAPASGERRGPRATRPGLDGILVVAKPAGPTSHDIVALVRRLAATKRVGHGGTLDPFATGVLPVFLGRATRLVEYHLGDRKGYRATVCLGAGSTTDDLDGELTPVAGPAPDRAAVEAALDGFRGPIRQVPPAYSAIKVQGRRAYALSRAGAPPELQPREVTIHRLDLAAWDDRDPDRPIAVLEVECSAGTYVRALARDLGLALGSAAYLGALVRTSSGGFALDDALTLDAIRAASADGPDGLRALLLPLDAGLDRFARVIATPTEVEAIGRGQFVRPAHGLGPGVGDGDRLLVQDEAGRLVAVAVSRGGRLAPDKVLVDPPPANRLEGSVAPAVGAPDHRSVAVAADDADAVEAAIATERDPSSALDPDPASPDEL